MKLFYDLLPILLFFIAYKWYGIFMATMVAIVAVTLQIVIILAKKQKPDLMQLITFVMIVLLGGSTLILQNELFIKWKPTAVYWVLAVIFAGSQWIGEKSLVEKMLDKSLSLPHKAWKVLNLSWVLFFMVMGVLNLLVVHYFDTNTWVNFKLFGTLGLTLVFVILQSIIVSQYTPNTSKND